MARSPLSPVARLIVEAPPAPPPSTDVRAELTAAQTALDAAAAALLSVRDHIARARAGIG